MLPRLLIALSFLVFAAPASASVEPDPGEWSSSGSRARLSVSFAVDGDVSPSVVVKTRRCGRRSITFRPVPVVDGRFSARARSLRLAGTFDSSFEAHGSLRGTIKRGRKVCKLRKLSWTAELAAPGDDEEAWDDESWEDEEEYAPDEYDPEAEEEYGPDDEVEYDEEYPGDSEEEYPEDSEGV